MSTNKGLNVIGKPMPRVEDERHLIGRSRFVADVPHEGCVEVAFLRSPYAFGEVTGVEIPAEVNPDWVWTAQRLEACARPIVAKLHRPQFNEAPWPLLATERGRFVGEGIAALTAPTRAEAEDRVGLLQPQTQEWPAEGDWGGEVKAPATPS